MTLEEAIEKETEKQIYNEADQGNACMYHHDINSFLYELADCRETLAEIKKIINTYKAGDINPCLYINQINELLEEVQY